MNATESKVLADCFKRKVLHIKGQKNTIVQVEVGLHSDDFIRDRRTIIVIYKSYKKPRYIN